MYVIYLTELADVALRKPAWQSGTYEWAVASLANNGIINQYLERGHQCSSATATSGGPWWKTYLGQDYAIIAVNVLTRVDCCCKEFNCAGFAQNLYL